MALEFRPPEWLLQEYLNRKSPGQQVLDSANQAAQLYLVNKNQQAKSQQDKLDGWVQAYGKGGPGLAADYAKQVGLKNPPALPGLTRPQVGLGGTAGVMSNQQPSMLAASPAPVQAPAIDPTQGDYSTLNEELSGQSLPQEHQMQSTSPIISHWHSSMGSSQAPQLMAPTAISTSPAQAAEETGQLVPGYDDKALLTMGEFGKNTLGAGEAYQKRQESKQAFDQKQLENAPRSANQLRQDFTLAGQPDKADAWLQAHAPESLSDPDKPLINVAQIKEAKDWLGTGASQLRGNYFDTMGNIQTQKLREGLMKDARTTLDPMFQTGEGRAQMQRLNNIGRTEPLIAQMLSQKAAGDPRQMRELATRVDSILKGSPGGQQAIEGINGLVPDTARGKFAGWFEWFTNDPTGTDQQAFIHRYADTINREKTSIQGQVKQTAERGAGTLRVLKSQFPDDYNAVVNPYVQGKYSELTGENVPTVASDEEFKALPSGAKFKDPSGQTHTKN